MKLSPARIAALLLPAALVSAIGTATAAQSPTPPSRPIVMEAAPGSTTIHGKLHVFYSDDFEHHRSSVLYFVEESSTHKLVRVRPSRALRTVGRSGRKVTVTGTLSGENLTLDAAGTQAFEATVEGTTTDTTASATTSATGTAVQTRRTIVMMASFQDVGAECLVSTIQSNLFGTSGSVDALYQEASLGQLGFSGDVVGPYAVADTATGKCDLAGWSSALDAQAAASGIDLSQFQNKVYVLPSKSSCAVGVGTVGGSPGIAFISRCGMPDAFAHELGHNLGMNHAGTPTDSYGDTSDIMGYSGIALRSLNAPHMQQLGWRASTQVRSVTSSGTFDVAPLELAPSQAVTQQILRIAKPDTGEEYYVSVRQPVGFDASLSASYQRLTVHRYANAGGRTYLMGTYADGQSFTDSTNGITITAVSHTSSYTTVQVQIGTTTTSTPPPACVRNAPTLSLSPASQSGTAGQTLSYTYTVKNNDSTDCAASTFSFARSVPTGWTGTLSVASVALSPGASSGGSFSLTSPSTASAGTWTAGVSVSDAALTGHSASGTVSASLSAPVTFTDTQAPTTPGSPAATANKRKSTITVTWMASTDNVGVAGYEVWRDGTKIATASGTSYVDSVTDTTTHSYVMKAFDAAGNRSSASTTVSAKLGSTTRK